MKSGDRLNQIEPLIAEMLIKLDQTAAKVDRVSEDVAGLIVLMKRNSETLEKHTDILFKQSDAISFLLKNQLLTNDKIDKMDGRIDKLDTKIGKIDIRIDNLDTKIGKIDIRIDNLDTKIGKLDTRIDKLDTRIDNLEIRMDRVENRLDKIEVKIDKIDNRLDKIEITSEAILTLLKNRN